MPIESCRGPEKKRKIFTLYALEIGPRCIILPHQLHEHQRNECCGKPLEAEFVQFFYEPRFGDETLYSQEFPLESGSFFVGSTCAKQFVELMHEEEPAIVMPPPFNPLVTLSKGSGGSGGGEGGVPRPTLPESGSPLSAGTHRNFMSDPHRGIDQHNPKVGEGAPFGRHARLDSP